MLCHMADHPAGWRLPDWCALVAVAGEAAAGAAVIAAGAAVIAAGADVVDLGDATQAQVAAFRAAHPAVPICASARSADIVRDQRIAADTGAWLICPDLQSAQQSGLAASQLLVAASPAEVTRLAAAGWHPVVDADLYGPAGAQRRLATPLAPMALDRPDLYGGPDLAGVIAAAALSAWLGAAAVLTAHPGPVRQALDMTASIAGRRPPARAVRGLA
jgi:hypothetical protein